MTELETNGDSKAHLLIGLRSPSRRPTPFGAIAAVCGLGFVALYPVLPAREVILAVVGLLLVVSSLRRLDEDGPWSQSARALIGAFCLGVIVPAAWWRVWPVYLIGPLAIVLALSWFAGARSLWEVVARGRFGRAELIAVLAIAAVAATGLGGWFVLFDPDLSALRAQIPQWPWFALLGAGAGFSVLNAALEEVIWRGLLLRWMSDFLPAGTAVVAQAVSFGAAHYIGFPSGPVGVGLATLYGLMLGALALRSKGLLAPFFAHIVTDMVIFALLLAG